MRFSGLQRDRLASARKVMSPLAADFERREAGGFCSISPAKRPERLRDRLVGRPHVARGGHLALGVLGRAPRRSAV
jgi:hypothetical protein